MQKSLYYKCLGKYTDKIDITWEALAKEYGIASGKILSDRWQRIRLKINPILEEDDLNDENMAGETDNVDVWVWANDEDYIKFANTINTTANPTNTNTTPTPKYNEFVELASNGLTTSQKLIKIFESDCNSPRALMIAHGLDPELWQVVSYKNNMWNMPKKESNDPYTMLQSKITVKPLVTASGLSLKDIEDLFQKMGKDEPEKPKTFKLNKANIRRSGLTAEINFADLHVGNIPGLEERTIEEKVEYVLDDIIFRLRNVDVKQIILSQLGDVFHYDTYARTTTGGTAIDSGMPFPTMFDLGAKLMIRAIDRLAEVAPVDFINISGNHDRITSYALGKALEFYYRENELVNIDATHSIRKFRVIGKNLVHWVHGDMPKKNLSSIPQRETRKEYGESMYCEIHAGHVHHQQTLEADGVIVRFLPSLTETDAWHFNNGYVGSLRSVACFIWDDELGLRDIWFSGAK